MGVYIKDLKMPKETPIRITIYPNGTVVKADAVDYEEFESIVVYDFEYHEEHSLQELADTLGVDKNYIKGLS